MGRAPCCDKAKVKRGPWSPEEDATLRSHIEIHGTGGNWIALPHKIGLRRCGKSCRLRWLNYLRPNLRHGGYTDEEDNLICSLYLTIGSRWSIIAAQLPGRTDNDIKNYWNTRLKKKLLGKQRRDGQQTRRRITDKLACGRDDGSNLSTSLYAAAPVNWQPDTMPLAGADFSYQASKFEADENVATFDGMYGSMLPHVFDGVYAMDGAVNLSPQTWGDAVNAVANYPNSLLMDTNYNYQELMFDEGRLVGYSQ